jgi:hypothetical protein
MAKVRRGPKGANDGDLVEVIEGGGTLVLWREDGVAVAVRLAGANTRPRKEKRGRWITQARAREGGREGKGKASTTVIWCPLKMT